MNFLCWKTSWNITGSQMVRPKRRYLIFSEKLVLEKGKVATPILTESIQLILKISNGLGRSQKKQEVENDLLFRWVPEAGLEPARPQWSLDFKSNVSTNSTTRATFLKKKSRPDNHRIRDLSGKRDSNPRPRPWQGRALPTELFPRFKSGCKCRNFFIS